MKTFKQLLAELSPVVLRRFTTAASRRAADYANAAGYTERMAHKETDKYKKKAAKDFSWGLKKKSEKDLKGIRQAADRMSGEYWHKTKNSRGETVPDRYHAESTGPVREHALDQQIEMLRRQADYAELGAKHVKDKVKELLARKHDDMQKRRKSKLP